ncbi:uncharacterized protein [Parasteatoda tepidariorum]|uniref:uncharacterized protein isoform X1 n=1 Tax=Parasteatoda tepidariorum TaxID=114398 RepID=UPI001C71B270|nr:uncharacterized protein LOC107440629 isoform X1 [Parasteatoda tepidariorum]
MQWITIALLGTLAGYVACDMKNFLIAAEKCEENRNADILKDFSFCKTQSRFFNCLSEAVFNQNVKFHKEPYRVLFALKEACLPGTTLHKELQVSADCTLETIQDFTECIGDPSPLLEKSIKERSKMLCPKLDSMTHCMQVSVKNKCKKVSSTDFFLILVEPIISFQKRLCQLLNSK